MFQLVSRHAWKFCLPNIREMHTKMSLRFTESNKLKHNAGKNVKKLRHVDPPLIPRGWLTVGIYCIELLMVVLIGKTLGDKNVATYSKKPENKYQVAEKKCEWS